MKNNMMKKVSLTALSALFAVSLSAGVATLMDTTADGTEKRIFAGGAGVRVQYDEETQETDGKNGIRFATYLQNVSLSEVIATETLIIPADLLAEDQELTSTTDGVMIVEDAGKWHEYTDDTYGEVLCSYAVVYDMPAASYSRDMVFQTSVVLSDNTILAMDYRTDDNATRSMAQVAKAVEESAEYQEYGAGKKAIIDEYQVVAEAGTYVEFDALTLNVGENTASINVTPAFWSNYYKTNYNTVSLGVTVTDGDVADVTALTYTPDEGTAVNIPLSGLTAGVEKQVPFDYASGLFTSGTFTATIADGSTAQVTVKPMKASKVDTVEITDRYWYSREDQEVRLNFVDKITETADNVLAVKYNGVDVAYTLNTEKNRIVFADEILADVDDGATAKTIEVQTATTKYQMTCACPNIKIFYEADDLFVERADGTVYSYFDYGNAANVDGWTTQTGTYTSGSNKGKSYTTYYRVGPFRLGADIDLSNDDRVVRQSVSGRPTNANDSAADAAVRISGFRGTFYGDGHTIKGMTYGQYGLFGFIGVGANIQNVAFTDVKASQDTKDNYAFLFGGYIGGYTSSGTNYGATFTNVYVEVDELQLPYSATAPTATNWVNSGVLAAKLSEYTTMTNFIVDMTDVGNINVVGRGAIITTASIWNSVDATNVYVISKAPLQLNYGGSNTDGRYGIVEDAANKASAWNSTDGKYSYTGSDYTIDKFAWIYGTSLYNSGKTTVNYGVLDITAANFSTNTEVYRFDSVGEMKTYISANSVSLDSFTNTTTSASYDESPWEIQDGVPVWKTAA